MTWIKSVIERWMLWYRNTIKKEVDAEVWTLRMRVLELEAFRDSLSVALGMEREAYRRLKESVPAQIAAAEKRARRMDKRRVQFHSTSQSGDASCDEPIRHIRRCAILLDEE